MHMATTIKRERLTIESAGRIASEAARLLQGKHKPQYEPQNDHGDFVEIRNAAKMRITGKKAEQKKYYQYSGYPGGMRVTKLKEVLQKDPADAVRRAIWSMLPKNRLRKGRLKRLRVKND